MKQKIFLALLVLVLAVGGWSMISNFMVNHQYYGSMFATGNNRYMIVWAIIATLIPLAYIVYHKKRSLRSLILSIGVGLLLYSSVFVFIKDSMIQVAGVIILWINVLIIFGLGIFSIVSWTALGSRIVQQFLKIQPQRWQDMLLSFGLGMGAMMLVVHFLVIFGIFYPLLSRLLLLVGCIAIRHQRHQSLALYADIIKQGIGSWHIRSLKDNKRLWIGVVLLGLSIVYFYYGFQLSFIPYSTAWDANHAYLYIPKVWAENHGALGRGQPGSTGGSLWMSYIAYFFSLIQPIKSRFWLSADNIAVSMNFLSGLFVLIFGVGLVKEFVGYIASILQKTQNVFLESLGLYAGWIGLLLRITSGMGAFLVFVDNKTDMGVLAMSVLAMLSGFIFIRYIHDHKHTDNKDYKTMILRYIVLSGIFFGLAISAKPTAFIDVVVFVLLLVALWINSGVAIGSGLVVLAVLSKIQPLFTGEFMTESAFIPLMVVGVITIILSLVYAWRKQISFVRTIQHTLRTLLLWGVTALIVTIIIKGPYIIINGIQSSTLGPKTFINGLLMGQKSNEQSQHVLLASTDNSDALAIQSDIDNSVSLPPAICSMESMGWTDEDLDKNVHAFVGGNGLNEDVGRYVGFGWKEFSHGLGYRIMRLFWGETGRCYGWDTAARTLCTYEDAINNFDIAVLYDVLETLPKQSKGFSLLEAALVGEKLENMLMTDTFNPVQMRDEIINIRQRYQGRSIKARADSLMIPYTYIVPRNAVFNRSLQNLSSYYTDIGFFWGILILIQILGLIYGIAVWNHRLIVMHTVTFLGWIVWWIIAGGIVWYGIGLIIWSILTSIVLLLTLSVNNKDYQEKLLYGTSIGLLILWASIQILMNLIRISSQGGGGPFVWYKMSAGMQNVVSNTLIHEQKLQIPYTRKNVFDLQFAHYNKFIEHSKDRPDDHGVSIAGTYLQYFLHNQHNVGSANIYELTSDGNTCKSYLRFHRDKRKYIVIDPNILSVVMGEGNESLMHRFFARRNPVTGRIDADGEMTMLVRMWYDGYLTLFSTNNLGAKYAFLLSDEQLMQSFSTIQNNDDLVFLRAKMGVARFFPDSQEIINFVGNVFVQRILNGQGVGDIADVFGKIIDEAKVFSVAQMIIQNNGQMTTMTEAIDTLSQDEKFVLSQYLGLYSMSRQNPNGFQESINQILIQSIAGNSQLIVFELK